MPKKIDTVILNREKETPNSVRFSEEEKPGKPPVLKTVYLPKWLAGNAASIKVDIEIL